MDPAAVLTFQDCLYCALSPRDWMGNLAGWTALRNSMPSSADNRDPNSGEASKQSFGSYFAGVSPSEMRRAGESAFIAAMLAPVVSATQWFDPGSRGKPYAARIRFSGRRLGVKGRPTAGDRFELVETVQNAIPGTGPVSVTARAIGVEPGDWLVTAEVVDGVSKKSRIGGQFAAEEPARSGPSRWRALFNWGTPRMSAPMPAKVKTTLGQLAVVPGSITGAWPALVGVGVVAGLVVQQLLVQRAHLNSRPILVLSIGAIVAGAVGSKIWYLAVSRQVTTASLTDGLCIQGFIAGAALVLIGGLLLLRLPLGTFLDASAPGVFFGMAIGRPGCFLTGCCAGRITASRWGVWASDRRVGARRVPVQLWEAMAALVIAVTALTLVLQDAVRVPGAVALGGVAAYTLGRQLLLPFRVVPRRTLTGRNMTLVLAGLIALADVVCWMVTCL